MLHHYIHVSRRLNRKSVPPFLQDADHGTVPYCLVQVPAFPREYLLFLSQT